MDYHYKYKKYKHKYYTQKGRGNSVHPMQSKDSMNTFMERLEHENSNVQLTQAIYDFLEKHKQRADDVDVEEMNRLKNTLLVKFVKDIAKKNIIDIDIMHQIALIINKINHAHYAWQLYGIDY